jgi:NAD-dependent DNA ligase
MKAIDIQGVGPGIVTKLYDAGFDSIKKIFNIKYEDIIKIDGFKEKSANNVLNGLSKIHSVDCLNLMDASNVFGRGYGLKKLKMITDKFPCLLNFDKVNRQKSSKLTINDLITTDGIAEISAKLFIDNLPKFYVFYDDLNIKCNSPIEKINDSVVIKTDNANINGKGFLFTGFRSKEHEKMITDLGGVIKSSISKSLDYLIIANKDTDNTKVKKAEELGIKIIDIKELENLL